MGARRPQIILLDFAIVRKYCEGCCRHSVGTWDSVLLGGLKSKRVPRISPDPQRTRKRTCFSTNPSLFREAFFGRAKSRAPCLPRSRAERLHWFQGKPSVPKQRGTLGPRAGRHCGYGAWTVWCMLAQGHGESWAGGCPN